MKKHVSTNFKYWIVLRNTKLESNLEMDLKNISKLDKTSEEAMLQLVTE